MMTDFDKEQLVWGVRMRVGSPYWLSAEQIASFRKMTDLGYFREYAPDKFACTDAGRAAAAQLL